MALGRFDTSSYNNFGPPIQIVQPNRCGHCGRFLSREERDDLDAFAAHLDGACPVGGVFVNGKLRKPASAATTPGDRAEGDGSDV